MYKRQVMNREQLAENLALVQARMAAAAQRAGRDPSEVTLVAVSKTLSLIHISEPTRPY